MSYQITTLANQCRIASLDLKGRESVAIGILIGAGGRYEHEHNNGVAHFLEHMVFRGTANYTCDQIKQEIEGVGGSVNAFTADEQTCFYVKVPKKHWKKALDILMEMVFFPKFKAKDFERERGIILEEIKMYQDLPQYFVLDQLDEMMWPNQPLGRNLAGTLDTVAALSLKDLKSFHKQCYTPENVIMTAVGACVHSQFKRTVRKKIEKLPAGQRANYQKVNHDISTQQLCVYEKSIEQVHLALGISGYAIKDKHLSALVMLSMVMGGNMSSRLFDELREKRGLAYSVSSSIKAFYDTGAWIIRAGVEKSKINEVIQLILAMLAQVKRKGITAQELERAKEYHLGQLTLSLEDHLDQMLWGSESLLVHNRIKNQQEVRRKIKSVTCKDVQEVAKALLQTNKYHLSLVGPISKAQQREIKQVFAGST